MKNNSTATGSVAIGRVSRASSRASSGGRRSGRPAMSTGVRSPRTTSSPFTVRRPTPASQTHWTQDASKGNAVLYRYEAEDGQGVKLGKAHERNRGPQNDP